MNLTDLCLKFPVPKVCTEAPETMIEAMGFGGRRQERDMTTGHIWQSSLVDDTGPLTICIICLIHKSDRSHKLI